MSRFTSKALFAATIFLFLGGYASAQDFRQLAQTCDATLSSHPAARIAACTALIETRSLNLHDSALAYMHRAWPYSQAGNMDLALQDLNEAARLDPQSPMILSDRGFARLQLNQLAAAIADYDAALRLNPRTVYALYGRGIARLRTGDTIGGNADLDAARRMQANVDNVFAGLGIKP